MRSSIPLPTPFPHTPVRRKRAYERALDTLLRALVRLRLVGPAPDNPASDTVKGGDCVRSVVLPFPIRGEALLVKLASELRGRVTAGELEDDPFLATLSRGRRARLSIDRDAYVEFNAEDETFHLKIDAMPVLTLTLETKEFARIVEFVFQYFAERDRGLRQVEVVS
ncbi:hypothetical protein [Bradyrhizobium cenepequi]|uniref:hypothetical protein n=1 Tax=Bradyrhizobium cenepequi TaxID=2821403 RepID=UPI001CE25101|nr:hypothetical protein [Bradyrhizobium cenepequi]